MPKEKRDSGRKEQTADVSIENEPAANNNDNDSDDDQEIDDANALDTEVYEFVEDDKGGVNIGKLYIPPPPISYTAENGSRPRLIITRIINNNFKSYVGEVKLGPFHKCFNAIIGPNGSGKSNVIDSMLFVFGYRATKLRCKSLNVLLHKSTTHGNKTDCRVSVHFKQIIEANGSTETVPNSEFCISRSVYMQDGKAKSTYTINDRTVTFKDISALLEKHHVDLHHNRFLILQGEVESIALMKCKAQNANDCGLLEYLEDIIGTTRFKVPLQKIQAHIEVLSEERSEKHNRCKATELEVKDLRAPMEEATKYLKLENDLTRTKSLQIQKYMSEHNKKISELKVEYEDVQKSLISHDEQFKAIEKKKDEKEMFIQNETLAFNKMTKKKEKYESDLKTTQNEQDGIQVIVTSSNKRLKTIKGQLEKDQGNIVNYKKLPERNEKEIVECQEKIESVTKQRIDTEQTLEKNLLTFQKQIIPFIEEKQNVEIALADLQKNVNETKSAYELSESELKILLHSETTEIRKYETLRNGYDDSRKSLVEKEKVLRESTIDSLKETLTDKQEALRKNKIEEMELAKEIRVRRADIDEKMNALQKSKSNNKVLDYLMKLKMEGKLPGVLGRLGDLGGINPKYDVAISTCCGRLDNIVVETVETAQQCIEHLKQSNMGRATFIALEKISHYRDQADRRIQTPENAPRLYDLIEVEDDRIRAAFYFSLFDTLVANELEQGTRIAYGAKRFRVVTLKGEVIEMAGTMSGGGKQMLRGRMGDKVRTKTSASADLNSSMSMKNLEKFKIETDKMRDKLSYLQEQQGHLENEIRTIMQDLKRAESDFKRSQIDVNNLKEQLPRIEQQLKVQQIKMDKVKADPDRVNELKEKIQKAKEQYERSDKLADEKRKNIETINKKIEDIRGDKVKPYEKKLDEQNQLITKLTKNISKLKVEITTSARNIQKCEQSIRGHEQELEKLQETITKCQTDTKENEVKLKRFKFELNEIEEKIETLKSDWSDIKKEIEELNKQINGEKLKRLELEKEVQLKSKELNDTQALIPYCKKELEALRLQVIPYDDALLEGLKEYTEEELNKSKVQDIQYKLSVQEAELKKLKPNITAIEDFYKRREVYLSRVAILEKITNKRNDLRNVFQQLKTKRYTEFTKGYQIITTKLKEMYQMITQGGDAELELVDSMDPFNEGVSFSVRPPKKSWKNISNLSGGEKTLSSLALVFALHYYKPSPLYFMDEIDAALDFRNVSIVANYIKERTKDAQFIIISLRSNMFELCDVLTGIYKFDESTDAITIANVPPTQDAPSQNGFLHNLGGEEELSSVVNAENLTNRSENTIMNVNSMNGSNVLSNGHATPPPQPQPPSSSSSSSITEQINSDNASNNNINNTIINNINGITNNLNNITNNLNNTSNIGNTSNTRNISTANNTSNTSNTGNTSNTNNNISNTNTTNDNTNANQTAAQLDSSNESDTELSALSSLDSPAPQNNANTTENTNDVNANNDNDENDDNENDDDDEEDDEDDDDKAPSPAKKLRLDVVE